MTDKESMQWLPMGHHGNELITFCKGSDTKNEHWLKYFSIILLKWIVFLLKQINCSGAGST